MQSRSIRRSGHPTCANAWSTEHMAAIGRTPAGPLRQRRYGPSCREGAGLFPAPKEIKLSCSCPHWADMCKHVAAVLYGVGARLDEQPQLLFVLRDVDENELLASAGQDLPLTKAAPNAAKVLDESDVAALFGLEMAETTRINTHTPTAQKQPPLSKTKKRSEKTADTKRPTATKRNLSYNARSKPEPKWAALVRARKRRAQRRRVHTA